MIRAPICTVVGHVDHGKTTLLDRIRGTAVAAGEAGAITQAIGASIIPVEHILERAGHMLDGKKLNIPGLLFIDTPGHAAFTSMRKRGGSLADIAILIVDINEGFKPQTKEALEILRSHKTPFIVAANKIDACRGYTKHDENIIKDLNAQSTQTTEYIETKLYQLVAELAAQGVPADRFDRIEGFDKQVAIVPISALSGQGINSLLAIIVGLAQRYLENNLHATVDGPAKGTVLEVSEEQGLGLTLNAILYDGHLNVQDTIVIASLNEPIVTKVRALLQPSNAGDLRDKKTRFTTIKQAVAATGVKISAPNLEGVAAGMPFAAVRGDIDSVRAQLKQEVQDVTIETDEQGVVLKADNIGSLEALITLLREKNISIRSAQVGAVTKKDLVLAGSNKPEHAVVLAFNVKTLPSTEQATVLGADIIYKLIDDYEEYLRVLDEKIVSETVSHLPKPSRMIILGNCIFRQSNPLVCGVEITHGEIKKGSRIVKEQDPHTTIGYVKEIQEKKQSRESAPKGMQVALSIPGAIGGKHVVEQDVLWSAVSEEEFRSLKEYAKHLSVEEKEVLKEFSEVMRKHNPLWGV